MILAIRDQKVCPIFRAVWVSENNLARKHKSGLIPTGVHSLTATFTPTQRMAASPCGAKPPRFTLAAYLELPSGRVSPPPLGVDSLGIMTGNVAQSNEGELQAWSPTFPSSGLRMQQYFGLTAILTTSELGTSHHTEVGERTILGIVPTQQVHFAASFGPRCI